MRVAAMAALLLGVAVAGEPLTEAQAKSFRWFEGLGYPDLTKLPFVRVSLLEESPEDADPFGEHGFLLREDENTFEIFAFGLDTRRFVRRSTDSPRRPGAKFERIALEDYVREGLRRLADPPPDDWHWSREPFGHRRYMPKLWFRVYVLAFACERRGHPELARELLRLPEGDERLLRESSGDVLRGLEDQVAAEALRNLTLDFGDPDLDWAHILARSKWGKEKFAAAPGSEWLDATIPRVQEIVEPTTAEPKDPVARLIRSLPDRVSCWEWGEKSLGAELVRLGVGAVPQLLEAWDDPRPSRSLEYGSSMKAYLRESVAVAPVRRHVRAIVEEIAGRRLETRAEAALWYGEVREHGEEAVLVRAATSGERHAPRAAVLLLARYPEAAGEAILAGIPAAKDEWVRETLVWNLRTLRADAATRLLLDELRAGEARRRVVAAWLLLLRGDRSGIPAVLEAWRKGSRGDDVSAFLATCGAAEGIAALQPHFRSAPARERADLLLIFLGERGWQGIREKELPAPDPAWAPAVEEFLVRALADDSTAPISLSRGRHSFRGPRICDMAALVLAEMSPERYGFDPDASIGRRDRRLVELRNAWLVRNGLPAVPVPKAPVIEPLPDDAAAALRDAFLKDRDPAPIERHGLAALPAVKRWLAAMPADDPARAPLELLRRRLGCLVASIDAPEDPGGILAALRDTSLTAEALVAALSALCEALPEASLWVSRDGDDTGIAIRLRPGHGTPQRDGRSWRSEVNLRAGGRWKMNDKSAGSGQQKGRWARLERRLADVLDADPSVAFELSLSFEG